MKEHLLIPKIAKKVCPAVITIAISKDLPKMDGFYFLPSSKGQFIVPKFEKGKIEKTKIGGGSGFIVSPQGLVLTSQHVVGDTEADYSVIVEPTKKYTAKVLARDSINDIAILKIEDSNLPYLELGDSNKIDLGETVLAVGNALGEFHDTLSLGIVSGLSRHINAYNDAIQETATLRGLIQTDAAINPGNSGGPLINMEGKVIGINTAVVAGAQNIGFAIPINCAKKDLEEVKQHGRLKRPFLGVRYIILNEEISQKNKLPINYGALIVRERLGEVPIIKGSPADKVKLQEFDIILECQGEKITTKNPLSNVLEKYKIGQKINLRVLRGKKKLDLKIELGERK